MERAFRAVPRHLFVAEGTPLDVSYNVDNSVAIKRGSDGVIISSSSAAYIQARMIEQAGLGPGMSVLEIGSGGFNAALLAEIVGPGGRVVSVDIGSASPGSGFSASARTMVTWLPYPVCSSSARARSVTSASKHGVSFADLHLWLAALLPGFCKLAADEGTDLAAERKSWFPFGSVNGDSFAYLAARPLPEGGGVEFGACAYGVHGDTAATAMVDQIQAWDREGRDREPGFSYWPAGSDRPELGKATAVLVRTHGVATISWSPTANVSGGRGALHNPKSEE